jgi:hypothetical protein
MNTGMGAIALLAVSLAGSASADDVAGAWKITGDVFGNAVNAVCTFAGTDASVTSTCVSDDGKAAAPSPATVTGKDVTWSWDAGQAVLTFKGTLDSGTAMKGDIEVSGVTGNFTGTKQ